MSSNGHPSKNALTRREVLKASAGAAIAMGATMLAAPAIAQERSIKVGAYGGYFEDSLKEYVYPEFTAATGIKVESVTQPDSTSWLQTMMQALQAGNVPTDLSMHTPVNIIKGERLGGILSPFDSKKIPNLADIDSYFLYEGNDGLLAVGSMGFYSSLVVNTEEVEPPTSWAELWDTSRFEASLGLPKNVNFNFLDVVATTFFDGPDTLRSHDGIIAAVEKTAEIHPNVALWYSAESQMEQALKNFDVIGGMYFHDVASLMAAEGHPIASIFPKEGNPINFNSWTLSAGSEKVGEAHEFVNFASSPAIQATMARKIGTAPVVAVEKTDLTTDEFDAVSGTPTIRPAFDVYLDDETFLTETWDKMVAKS